MRVILAMSGGVDSSAAALLLRNQGHDVIGVTFKNFDNNLFSSDPIKGGCCSLEQINRARNNCHRLGIPHYVLNRVDEFRREVLDDFALSYRSGITPNPCVRCNALVRWPELIAIADKLEADSVATGHYARIVKYEGKTCPGRATFEEKDQSYALWQVKPEFLERTIFPLGGYRKSDVRALAIENDLIAEDYKESQDICFAPDGDHVRLVGEGVPGEICALDGSVLGRHRGLEHYTIGQRRGLGISFAQPLYVVEIDRERNRVIVGTDSDLYRETMEVRDANWFVDIPIGRTIDCRVKIRYKHEPADCRVTITGADTAKVEFALPQRAVTPGQSAVFYHGDVVLGGGVIAGERRRPWSADQAGGAIK